MKKEKAFRGVGYKIVFSTQASKAEIEECFDAFLKQVEAGKNISLIQEMTSKEILDAFSFFADNS